MKAWWNEINNRRRSNEANLKIIERNINENGVEYEKQLCHTSIQKCVKYQWPRSISENLLTLIY
jgi:hypothetical protein